MGLGCHVKVHVISLPATSEEAVRRSGSSGTQAKGFNRLETPLRQAHAVRMTSSCANRDGRVQLRSKSRGDIRNRPRDLQMNGSAFVTFSDRWTVFSGGSAGVLLYSCCTTASCVRTEDRL